MIVIQNTYQSLDSGNLIHSLLRSIPGSEYSVGKAVLVAAGQERPYASSTVTLSHATCFPDCDLVREQLRCWLLGSSEASSVGRQKQARGT